MEENKAIRDFLEQIPCNSKAVLFSTTDISVCLKRYIECYRKDISLSFFVDSFKTGELDGLKIISPQSLKDEHTDAFDMVIVASYSNAHILENILKDLSISNYKTISRKVFRAINGVCFEQNPDKNHNEFVKTGHYYSVVPTRTDVIAGCKKNKKLYSQLPGIDFNIDEQIENLKLINKHCKDLCLPIEKQENDLYYTVNGWYPLADAQVLFSRMMTNKPRRIIEIGCGFSTGFMCDINRKYFNSSIKITCIEPNCERLMQVLGSRSNEVELYNQTLQNSDISLFGELQENDILFIDSSHVAKINSDVLQIFYEILPALKKGVEIHFHDIFKNFEYADTWLKEGRCWNEAYFLRAFLQYNTHFKIEYFTSFMHSYVKENCLDFEIVPGGANIFIKKV